MIFIYFELMEQWKNGCGHDGYPNFDIRALARSEDRFELVQLASELNLELLPPDMWEDHAGYFIEERRIDLDYRDHRRLTDLADICGNPNAY